MRKRKQRLKQIALEKEMARELIAPYKIQAAQLPYNRSDDYKLGIEMLCQLRDEEERLRNEGLRRFYRALKELVSF